MADGIKIDDLQIDIVVNAKGAEKAIDNLSDSLKNVGKGSNLSKVTKDVKNLGSASAEARTPTREVAEAVNESGEAAEKATPKLRAVTKTLKKSSQEVKTTAEEAKVSATQTASAVDNVAKTATKASTSIKTSNNSTKRSFKEFSKSVDTSNSKLAQLWASFKRIAMYRAIRSAIKALTNAVTEGFNMFVTWDREQNNGLAGASQMVDELKAKWFEVKGAIGAAVAPIAQTFLPVLKTLSDALIGIINLIQQAVRALRGEEYWYRAVYKDAEATTGAAKELKRVLFGFDELNVLPSLGGSGLSTEAGYVDYIKEEIPKWMKVVAPIAAALGGALATLKLIKGVLDKLKTPIDLATSAAGLLGSGLNTVLGIANLLATLLGGFARTITIKTETKHLKELKDLIKDTKKDVEDFDKWLNKNKLKVVIDIPKLDFTDAKKSIGEMQKYLKQNKLAVVATLPKLDFSEMQKSVNTMLGWLKKNPMTIVFAHPTVDFNYVQTAVANIKKYLENSTLTLKFNPPKPDFSYLQKAIENIKRYAENNPVVISAKSNVYEVVNNAARALEALQKAANNTPIHIKFYLNTSGFNAAIGQILKTVQNVFNVNPVKLRLQLGTNYVGGSQTYSNGGFTGGKIGGGFSGGGLTGTDDRSIFQKFTDWWYQNVNKRLGFYANGGTIPNTGSLFVAGESGAEVVANLGNSTGVMNVNQMQEAVASGNIEMINALYAVANSIIGEMRNLDMNPTVTVEQIGKAATTYQNNQARRGIAYGR